MRGFEIFLEDHFATTAALFPQRIGGIVAFENVLDAGTDIGKPAH